MFLIKKLAIIDIGINKNNHRGKPFILFFPFIMLIISLISISNIIREVIGIAG